MFQNKIYHVYKINNLELVKYFEKIIDCQKLFEDLNK